MVTDMAVDGGYVTERLLSYYEGEGQARRGAGHRGGHLHRRFGKTFLHGLDISDDRFIPACACSRNASTPTGPPSPSSSSTAGPRASRIFPHARRVMGVIPGVFEPTRHHPDEAEFARLARTRGPRPPCARPPGSTWKSGTGGYLQFERAVSLEFTNRRADG